MNFNEEALKLHAEHKGKIEIRSKVPVNTRDDLSTAYTPGVAEPCRKIHADKKEVYKYTAKGNLVAVVSDGTAVLGLGDIGRRRGCPSWRANASCSRPSAAWTHSPVRPQPRRGRDREHRGPAGRVLRRRESGGYRRPPGALRLSGS